VLSFFLFVSSVAASNSVTASPTNDTNALTQQFGSLRFFLSAATNSSVNEVNLAPLTSSLATLDYSSFQVCCNCHHTQCVSCVAASTAYKRLPLTSGTALLHPGHPLPNHRIQHRLNHHPKHCIDKLRPVRLHGLPPCRRDRFRRSFIIQRGSRRRDLVQFAVQPLQLHRQRSDSLLYQRLYRGQFDVLAAVFESLV
jgi:hypothetical protein